MFMFAQERFFFLETTWNEDPGIVLLYSTDEPITGVIYDTTFGYLRWEENYLNGIDINTDTWYRYRYQVIIRYR